MTTERIFVYEKFAKEESIIFTCTHLDNKPYRSCIGSGGYKNKAQCFKEDALCW